jgi:uncharacterized membrane protein
MKPKLKEKSIYIIFEYSLLLKTINSVWEIVLGLFIFFDTHLRNAIYILARNELAEEPNNFVAQYIQNFITHISHGTLVFISIYLIGQGVIKIFLILGIFKKKLWAYQLAIYSFLAFTFYQIFRYNHTHSTFLIILSIFDIVTIMLIQHEYKRVKEHLPDY